MVPGDLLQLPSVAPLNAPSLWVLRDQEVPSGAWGGPWLSCLPAALPSGSIRKACPGPKLASPLSPLRTEEPGMRPLRLPEHTFLS